MFHDEGDAEYLDGQCTETDVEKPPLMCLPFIPLQKVWMEYTFPQQVLTNLHSHRKYV